MTYESFVARRHLRSMRRRRRVSITSLIAACGVAIGVAALVIVLSVMNGFSGMVWDRLLGVNAHVTVRRAYSQPIEGYGAVVKTVSEHPEVLGASPFLQSEGFVLRKAPGAGLVTAGVLVRGVEEAGLLGTSEIGDYMWAGEVDLGRQETQDRRPPYGVVMGRALANRLGVMLRSQVRVAVPKDMMGQPPMRTYVVTGIFSSGYYEFDSALIFVSLESAQRYFGNGDTVSGIRVKLEDPFEADRVGRQLREVLGETYSGLYTSSWMHEHGNLYTWIRMEKWFSFLALSLIVVVAGFNIISILTMNVAERRREIGILKAMGATPKSISRIFTLEGLAIGLSGVALGDLVGFAVCWIQYTYELIKLPGEVYIISALPVDMRALDFVVISVSAVALCYLFTRFPARDAAGLDPVEAIRYE